MDQPNRKPFLALTAHWIAEVDGTSTLWLKSALIAFHHICSRHTGELLATTLIGLLDRAGITTKVSTTAYHSATN
jgi:hypothetical protein